ncbi:hypothetical protein NPIL_90351, partial [Nephila pilipes]
MENIFAVKDLAILRHVAPHNRVCACIHHDSSLYRNRFSQASGTYAIHHLRNSNRRNKISILPQLGLDCNFVVLKSNLFDLHHAVNCPIDLHHAVNCPFDLHHA